VAQGRLREIYRARRDAMLAALDAHMPPGVRFTRPAGAEPFRVVALNHVMDFSHFTSEEDRDNEEKWKRVMGVQTEADDEFNRFHQSPR